MINVGLEFKYTSIARELERFVAEARQGAKLPSERELGRLFNCNVLTVRKALAPLANAGRIVKQAGRGSFVAAPATPPPVARDPQRLGLLIHQESDFYAMNVVRGANASAAAHGVEIRARWIKNLQEDAERAVAILVSEACSAVILPWFPLAQTAAVADLIRKSPLPVSVPFLLPGLEDNCFEIPSLFGRGTHTQTEAACEYLRLLGDGAIALVGPDSVEDAIMQARLSAYSRFVFRHGMENVSCPVGSDSAAMDALAASFAKRPGRLSVFCHDDLHASRLMTAMHKLGLSAPDDYRVLGCNNSNEAKFTDPPLSSVFDDAAYPGEALVRNALGLASGTPDQSEQGPAHHLMLRRSCGGAALLPELQKSLDSNPLILEVEK